MILIPGLRLIGTAPDKAGVLSFVLDGHRTEDIGAALNQEGIARWFRDTIAPGLSCGASESRARCGPHWPSTIPAEIDALIAAVARIAGSRDPSIPSAAPLK